MKRFLLAAIAAVCLSLTACKTLMPTTSIGKVAKEVASIGASDAHKAIWPLAVSSIICILAGVGYAVLLKNPDGFKILGVGIGLALIGPAFFLFGSPLVLPISIGMCFAGAMGLAMLGWHAYDYIRDGVVENRKADARA